MVRSTHGDDPRCIAGRRHTSVLPVAVRVASEIASRRDHGDPGLHGPPCRQRERIREERLRSRSAHREVDDADVVFLTVCDGEVDRLNGGADRAAAGTVEHLERKQLGARRDAGIRAVRIGAVAPDDARHVRAVTEVVIGHRASVDEIDGADEPRARVIGAGQPEIAVRDDARVDQRDTNAAAVPAPGGSRRTRCGRRGRRGRHRRVQGYERTIQVDAAHARIGGERIECAVGDLGNPRVERCEMCPGATADPADDEGAVARAVAQADDDASLRVAAARCTRLQRPIQFGAVLRGRQRGGQDRAVDEERGCCNEETRSTNHRIHLSAPIGRRAERRTAASLRRAATRAPGRAVVHRP